MAVPIATDKQQDPAQLINVKLVDKVRQLEIEQVDLRVEMTQRALEQDRLLFTARQTNQRAQQQLNESKTVIEQQNQTIGQQENRIANLEGQLEQVKQERTALQIQLNQQIGIDQQAQGYLQQRLVATNQRIEALGLELASERVKALDENRLTYLLGEQNRINCKLARADELGVGGGIGMIIGGTLLAGPIGFIGGYAAALANAAAFDCSVSKLRSYKKEVVSEIALVSQRLGREVQKS